GEGVRPAGFRTVGGAEHPEHASVPCGSALARVHEQSGARGRGHGVTRDGSELLRTQDLLREAQQGRRDALEALLARYRPRLERWATGRLPVHARSLLDTGDLVQETLLRILGSIASMQFREPGKFEVYVRQAVLNRIRDQVRWARRRAGSESAPEDLVDPTPSPLEEAIGADVVRRY